MKVRILSDIHREVHIGSNIGRTVQKLDEDLVILAGDIHTENRGPAWARETFENAAVVYVMGNHEFYGQDLAKTRDTMAELARKYEVALLDQGELVLGSKRFLGCTLWTDFAFFGEDSQEAAMRACRDGIADFSVIMNGKKTFSVNDALKLHESDVNWLTAKLAVPFDGETWVVTHHAPHARSVHDRYMTSLETAGFASDLNKLMGHSAYWVHGHTHEAFWYTQNGTQIVCNPLGYPGSRHTGFHEDLILEV